MTFILVYPIVVMVWLMCTACLCNVVIIDVNVNVNVNSRLLCGANRRVSKRIKLGFGVGFAIEDSSFVLDGVQLRFRNGRTPPGDGMLDL